MSAHEPAVATIIAHEPAAPESRGPPAPESRGPPAPESRGPPAPELAYIGPLPNGQQAREWALVLQSQSIAYIVLPSLEGWLLQISARDHARAVESVDLYEIENENWPPPAVKDTPRHEPTPVVALAFLAVLLFFFYVTGPARAVSPWFERGTSDALHLFDEPWRIVTALTLHADAQHAIGNAISGTIFGSMVARRIGPGAALLAVLGAGVLGNLLNALVHLPEGHRSIGASTAVFGAVGILAGVQTMVDWGRSRGARASGLVDFLAPAAGGLALLGALGAGRHTDLGAHGLGFLSGVGIGVFSGLMVRRDAPRPSMPLQLALGIAASCLVLGAWLWARS